MQTFCRKSASQPMLDREPTNMKHPKITIIPMAPPRKEERTFPLRDPIHFGRKRMTLAKYGIKGRGAVSM